MRRWLSGKTSQPQPLVAPQPPMSIWVVGITVPAEDGVDVRISVVGR